ncbi:MAG: hypothetical protein K6E29_00710 [Cyanobacteria bacterium RUI128]|nr:hypothetical protein [Cyanobacteria bacterium RUI128]
MKLHNSIAEINKNWDLERGENIKLTDAKHQTSEEYYCKLRDECNALENNLECLKI